MNKGFATLAVLIIGALVVSGAFVGYRVVQQEINQEIEQRVEEQVLGADSTLPLAGATYRLSGAGLSSSATTINITSLTVPQTGYEIQDDELSDTFYLTLEPGSRTRQEIISCTTSTQNADDTATFTGCTRGLLPFSPYTASSSYRFAHGGGTALIFSNPPQLYNQFTSKSNDEYITGGTWTFDASYLPRASSTPDYTSGNSLRFATYQILASTTAAGVAAGTESVAGIGIFATQAELILGTATSSYSGTTYNLFPQNRYFSATKSATTTGVVTEADGYIAQEFFKLSEGWIFTGGVTSTGAFVVSGASTELATTTIATSTTFTVYGTLNTPGIRHEQIFTTSTTWTVPSGVTTIYVTLLSGGGGGGGSCSLTSGAYDEATGGSGASGYYAQDLATTTVPGQTITITIGEGGIGGVGASPNAASGTNGTSTTVGGLTIAGGDAGGGGTACTGGSPVAGTAGVATSTAGHGISGFAGVAETGGSNTNEIGASSQGFIGGLPAIAVIAADGGDAPSTSHGIGGAGAGASASVFDGGDATNGYAIIKW